ncbi:DNA polymerase IV [Jeotgalibaca sp. MA1X17-3]|uniref:DNA polymerase IV n=1 Tax=Jeotgalibaca sp. MA1X17-3 TaxID=2908211 RepID=UPI001F23BDC3|nr:DNA polymerase IV [Jeotgalibaca sp. MA1X17-3]UJF14906.1 DNA polymerase IV [Jeotgalibaca sp. MA1X17-3]
MEYGLLTFKELDNDLNRKIIHIDMDAFYASVEERDNPSLKGKPLVIANDPRRTGGRGVVTTANYVARTYGIHSAMSSQKAFELCPHALFIPPRMDYYRSVSSDIRNVFLKYTDTIEPLSLDEAYLDVTQNKVNIPSASIIARKIQSEVWKEVGLTCSAGVSYNKFLAKMASDFKKPAGLTVITPKDAQNFLFELPIEKFYGVGEKTAEKLVQLNIKNGKDLFGLSANQLIDDFGKMGYVLFRKVRGIDNNPVTSNRERKSLGRELTYSPFLTQEEQVEEEIRKLSYTVSQSLEKHKVHGQVVVLKIRYADFYTVTRQKSFVDYVGSKEEIFSKAIALWEEHGEIDKEIRLLGITLTQLAPRSYTNIQLPLWKTTKL